MTYEEDGNLQVFMHCMHKDYQQLDHMQSQEPIIYRFREHLLPHFPPISDCDLRMCTVSAPLCTKRLGCMELSTIFVFPCIEGTEYNLEIDFRGCYRTTTVYNIRITTLHIAPGKLCCISVHLTLVITVDWRR